MIHAIASYNLYSVLPPPQDNSPPLLSVSGSALRQAVRGMMLHPPPSIICCWLHPTKNLKNIPS